MDTKPEFTVIYDSQCPICGREIAWLRSRNSQGKLFFQDIHAEAFRPEALELTKADLLGEIHGICADGRLIKGIDVFYLAYSLVGLRWLVAPLRWPLLRPFFEGLYAWFARYRVRLASLLPRKSCGSGGCTI